MLCNQDRQCPRGGPTFEGFYKEMVPVVLRVILLRTGSEQRSDVEDIAQEVFVAVYQKWQSLLNDPNLDGEGLRKYVLGIAVNKRVDGFRSRVRAKRTLNKLSNAHREGAVDIDETIFNSELWRWARTLPLKQRTVFALRFWGDMEGNEIATMMGVSPSTVRNHLVAIRKSYVTYFGVPVMSVNGQGEQNER